ncbi:MAG: ATP synthase F0 subunit C [Candidatus Omnitrophica bacterium]|nr:ATP synthase F0 subunit C [Candidatus Omnitrophota bacterium]
MDMKIALAFALPLGLGIAALGGALGLGKAIAAAMEAMGRQPEISNKILINMVLGCALIEAVVIYVLVYSFILFGKL